MKNKKFLIIFVFICSIVFCFFYYNFFKSGNNINRSQEQIVEDILKELIELGVEEKFVIRGGGLYLIE